MKFYFQPTLLSHFEVKNIYILVVEAPLKKQFLMEGLLSALVLLQMVWELKCCEGSYATFPQRPDKLVEQWQLACMKQVEDN